jgi:hypothetical protein
MWIDAAVLDLQIKLKCRYFDIFWPIFQKLGKILNNFLVTLLMSIITIDIEVQK